jgi:hypothetical protein
MEIKLGKRRAVHDLRTVRLEDLVKKVLPPIPKEFDFDRDHASDHIPLPMFANDKYGDCVLAARAHQTLRLELNEQKSVILISDKDVTEEYFKESGGYDNGLVMLDSMKSWRRGWTIAGQTYSIYAFGKVDPSNQSLVSAQIYLLTGANVGLSLPLSARDQLDAGKIWEVISGPRSEPGSWGGHCVDIPSFDADILECITWGAKQQMTREFFQRYCDENFGIVDNKDNFIANDVLDIGLLQSYLGQLSTDPLPPSPVPASRPCAFTRGFLKSTNGMARLLRSKRRFYSLKEA